MIDCIRCLVLHAVIMIIYSCKIESTGSSNINYIFFFFFSFFVPFPVQISPSRTQSCWPVTTQKLYIEMYFKKKTEKVGMYWCIFYSKTVLCTVHLLLLALLFDW